MRHHATRYTLRRVARELATLMRDFYNSDPIPLASYHLDPVTELLTLTDPRDPRSDLLTSHYYEPGTVAPYARRHD